MEKTNKYCNCNIQRVAGRDKQGREVGEGRGGLVNMIASVIKERQPERSGRKESGWEDVLVISETS